MNIVQVIPLLDFAGAEIMCETLTVELIKKGNNVSVISLYNHHSKITERMESKGIKIYYLNKKTGFDLAIVKELFVVLKNIKPDIVHTHLYALKYVIPACKILGIKKIVHTIHNVAEKESSKLNQKINFFLFNFLNVIPISLSAEIQRTVINRYKLNKAKTPIIYNGIDISIYQKKEIYETPNKLKFIHIGRFSIQKNHELLIEAFKIAHSNDKNIELVLIGKGELEDVIKQKVNDYSLQDSIFFLGIKENINECLYNSDVFILTSNYEGMPMTIIEAMATGLPIISTKVGGVFSMIENNRTGILVNANISELASAMLKMRDEAYRESLGKKARMKAEEEFSSKKMAEKYLEIYNK